MGFRRAAIIAIIFVTVADASHCLAGSTYCGGLAGFLSELFRRETMLTVGGVKPVSQMSFEELPPGCVSEFVREFRVAQDAGLIRNPDIRIWFHKLHVDSPQADSVSVYSLRSLEALKTDPKYLAVLDRYNLPRPSSAGEVFEIYRRAVEAGGYSLHGPEWANACIGASLGFPIDDAIAYARKRLNRTPGDRILVPWLTDPGFENPPRFAHFSAEISREVKDLQRRSNFTARTYQRMKNEGLSDLEIINRASELVAERGPAPLQGSPAEADSTGADSSDARLSCLIKKLPWTLFRRQ